MVVGFSNGAHYRIGLSLTSAAGFVDGHIPDGFRIAVVRILPADGRARNITEWFYAGQRQSFLLQAMTAFVQIIKPVRQ